ncbi:MAG: hypothetical protein ABSH48_03565 [Verrucomicrobiota bacterium]|jgi:hypothetical protein
MIFFRIWLVSQGGLWKVFVGGGWPISGLEPRHPHVHQSWFNPVCFLDVNPAAPVRQSLPGTSKAVQFLRKTWPSPVLVEIEAPY